MRFVKSALLVIPLQYLVPAPERAAHEAPPSVESQILSKLRSQAAIFEQSALHVIPYQFLLPALVSAAQDEPPSDDI